MADYQFSATARIPTRPLSKDNEDLREAKELLIDYTDGSLYVSDENKNLIPAGSQLYTEITLPGSYTYNTTGSYYNIPITDLKATHNPIIGLKIELEDLTNNVGEEFAKIYKATTFDGYMYLYVIEKITKEITIQVKV